MTTDDLVRIVNTFTATNGRGPMFDELQRALVMDLHIAIADDELAEELDKAMQAGLLKQCADGTFII